MTNSPHKRSHSNFQKMQQDYFSQENEEIFAKYPFYHQGVPELPDELYPMPKKRTNYKIDEIQNYENNNNNNQDMVQRSGYNQGRKKRNSSIREEDIYQLECNTSLLPFQIGESNEESRFQYPQLSKHQLKNQDKKLSMVNEQKELMNYRMKEERENKKKAYENYLEQLNDKAFDRLVEMTKHPQNKIQITIDENDVSVNLIPLSEIKKIEDSTQVFYQNERSIHEKKKTLKKKLIDRFNVKLNFEMETFLDKDVYDFYNNQQLNDIKTHRKQSLGQQYQTKDDVDDNNINNNPSSSKTYGVPATSQKQIPQRKVRQFNSLQTSPRTNNSVMPYQHIGQNLLAENNTQNEQKIAQTENNNTSFNSKQKLQFTEQSPTSSIQLRTSPSNRYPYENQKININSNGGTKSNNNYNNNNNNKNSNYNLLTSGIVKSKKGNQDKEINQQYSIPTEASCQSSIINLNTFGQSSTKSKRNRSISPYLFQSASRNSYQLPSIHQHSNRGNSSSRYKMTSPRSRVFSLSRDTEQQSSSPSQILKQGGDALEILKKENQALLNSKFTREHAKIINSIRNKSNGIVQAMKQTDDSFNSIVNNIKHEQIRILNNLTNAKAPQSVQVRLINDFQNILGIYGAQLS